jgi:predicted small secreted protein
MKRTALILLALLMVACCVLAACEGEGAESVTEDASSEASAEESKEESLQESLEESSEGSLEVSDEDSVEESVDESIDESVEEGSEPDEESVPDEEDESSQIIGDPKDIDPINCLFARYTQKPTFVIIGTCEMGATITAEFEGQKVSVPSYMGWFTLSLNCDKSIGTTLQMYMFQTVDGVRYKPELCSVRPTEPNYLGTRAVGSNKAFQFFLEQMIPDFVGGNLYATSAIEGMKSRIQTRLAEMRKHNKDAEIIYMIVPSPMTTYPELVPETYKKGSGQTRLDQVFKGITEAGGTVIDLRDSFVKHKNDEMPLYYHLDSHWADYGAYLAYVELFDHISDRFPKAAPRDIDDFTWTADYYVSADACLYLGIPQQQVKEYGYYREFDFKDPANITSVPRYRGMQLIYNDLTTEEKIFNTGNADLPSCIVFRDSYSAGIYDILAERMNRTHYIGMWNYAWRNNLIESEKPDYVIYLIAEWNMNEVVYR